MTAEQLLAALLNLESPWRVEGVAVDTASLRVDVKLGVSTVRALFKRNIMCARCRRALPERPAALNLRHYNMGTLRIFVQVPDLAMPGPRPACPCGKTWQREGSRYTASFERAVQAAITGGLDRATLRNLYALSPDELQGLASELERQPASSRPDPSQQRDASGFEVEFLEPPAIAAVTPTPPQNDAPQVPPPGAACWSELLRGTLPFRTESVSLVMLIERVRLSLSGSEDASREAAGERALREYFMRHARTLGRELGQLRQGAAFDNPLAAPPAPDHPGWQQLIDGRIPVRPDALGLQMLLERVRLTLGENPDPSLRQAAARTVHDFFVRHGARHREELARLHGRVPASTPAATAPRETRGAQIPPESDPIWRRLLEGDADASRGSLPLQLLLQRLRMSLGDHPSPEQELQCIRSLRSYFLRAQGTQPRPLAATTDAAAAGKDPTPARETQSPR
jgi:hypothetical protein